MYNKKMLFMPQLLTPGAGVEDDPGMPGSGKPLNIWILHIIWNFFLHRQWRSLKGMFLRLGCTFNSKWHYLKHNSICTTGQVLIINNIYTYNEGNDIEIVRLTDVHIERGYLYCSLFFFSKNKIITVRQSLLKDVKLLWRLIDIEEYNEIMSRRLWNEVNRDSDFWESGS